MDQHNSSLERLSRLADDLAAKKRVVLQIEADLKRAQKDVQDLEEGTIPAVMDELGMKMFTTTSGFQISIEESNHPSILVENRDKTFRWFEAHGHGGMIKRAVTVAFNREQSAMAKDLQAELMGRGYPGVKSDESVHPSTLRSWVNHRLEAGEEIPETINIQTVRVAKIEK